MIKQPSLPIFTKDGKFFPNSDFEKDTLYKTQDLSDARKLGGAILTNAIRKINNSKVARMKKGVYFIQDIFRKYWPEFKELYKSRLQRSWAKAHQSKGIYVGKDKTRYFQFASHNEKDPVTGKTKKVYDRFIGRITEEDGLIPRNNKLKNFYLVEFGLSYFFWKYCRRNIERCIYNESISKNEMVVGAILLYIYGQINETVYKLSYLSHIYKDINFTLYNPNRIKRIKSIVSK